MGGDAGVGAEGDLHAGGVHAAEHVEHFRAGFEGLRLWAGERKLSGLAASRATKSPASRVGTRQAPFALKSAADSSSA